MGLFGNIFSKARNSIGNIWNSSKGTIGDIVATTSDLIRKVPGLLIDALPNEGKLGQIKKAYGFIEQAAKVAPGMFDKIAGTESHSVF